MFVYFSWNFNEEMKHFCGSSEQIKDLRQFALKICHFSPCFAYQLLESANFNIFCFDWFYCKWNIIDETLTRFCASCVQNVTWEGKLGNFIYMNIFSMTLHVMTSILMPCLLPILHCVALLTCVTFAELEILLDYHWDLVIIRLAV